MTDQWKFRLLIPRMAPSEVDKLEVGECWNSLKALGCLQAGMWQIQISTYLSSHCRPDFNQE